MTRLEKLQEDLSGIINGCGLSDATFRKSLGLIVEYAPGYGTGYTAYSMAKEEIERLIKEEKTKKPTLSKIKAEFEHFGAVNQYTRNYIEALERCRPWVIRHSVTGNLWIHSMCDKWFPVMFASKSKAKEYWDNLECGSNWEIVQREGESE